MTRWIRLWPTGLSAVLVVAAVLAEVREPAPPDQAVCDQEPPPPWRPTCMPPYPEPIEALGGGLVGQIHQPFEVHVFHHSELPMVSQVDPVYPAGGVGKARCLVQVVIDPDGVPTRVGAEAGYCARAFAEESEAAVRAWRWEPPFPRYGQPCIYAKTTVAIRFSPPS